MTTVFFFVYKILLIVCKTLVYKTLPLTVDYFILNFKDSKTMTRIAKPCAMTWQKLLHVKNHMWEANSPVYGVPKRQNAFDPFSWDLKFRSRSTRASLYMPSDAKWKISSLIKKTLGNDLFYLFMYYISLPLATLCSLKSKANYIVKKQNKHKLCQGLLYGYQGHFKQAVLSGNVRCVHSMDEGSCGIIICRCEFFLYLRHHFS